MNSGSVFLFQQFSKCRAHWIQLRVWIWTNMFETNVFETLDHTKLLVWNSYYECSEDFRVWSFDWSVFDTNRTDSTIHSKVSWYNDWRIDWHRFVGAVLGALQIGLPVLGLKNILIKSLNLQLLKAVHAIRTFWAVPLESLEPLDPLEQLEPHCSVTASLRLNKKLI